MKDSEPEGLPPSRAEEGTNPTQELSHQTQVMDSTTPEGSERPVFTSFETIELLGQGGMGTVWKVRQKALDRIVALKVLNAGILARASELKRFKKEASAAAKLQHPSLIPIYEIGEERGCSYFTMEYVEGLTLAELLKGTPLEPRRAAEYLHSMAEAIEYAHRCGVLHRDLKPANVIIDLNGRPRIMDFGLAREIHVDSSLTQSGVVIGTPSYMSPEQAAGNSSEISERSDVYSLGAVLYEMITGRPPFRAHNTDETLHQAIHLDPALPRSVNPKVPRDLETICMKCVQKEPGHRYQSARELAEDLGRFLRWEPIRARPIGVAGRAWRVLRRNPVVAGFTASIAILLAVMSVSAIFARQDLLRSNAHTARVTAMLVQKQLEGLAARVMEFADDPRVIQALQSNDVKRLEGLLTNVHHQINTASKLRWLAGNPFQNWNIYNLEGGTVARSIVSDPPRVGLFKDRDHFKGAVSKWMNDGIERVHVSKVFYSRYDRDYKFGLSAPILSTNKGERRILGAVLATVTTRSSDPMNDLDRKVVLIGRSDPSDSGDVITNFTFRNYSFVLHPAYSFGSPAVAVDRFPFNAKNTTHNLYHDPAASKYAAYKGLWLAGSAKVNMADPAAEFYVLVQSRDWILMFLGITFAILMLFALIWWLKRRRGASSANSII